MPREPKHKRVIAFFDGQNLFHSVREVFGYTFPNFDVSCLAQKLCEQRSWQLTEARFYTGIPARTDDASWRHFWDAKLLVMSRQGVKVYSRELRYRNRRFKLEDGSEHIIVTGEEKGIDVRIAIDIISLTHRKAFDVALVFSQDQDLSEVADEIRFIATEQRRWIKMASAFPVGPTKPKQRGINKTDWLPFDRKLYDSCLDRRDYRPKKKST